MEHLFKRIGYFLRETNEGKGGLIQENRYIVRYFIIDNDCNLHYTMNYSTLQGMIESSDSFTELYGKVSKVFKSIKIAGIKVGKAKDYTKPEFMPFLNQRFCDVELKIADPDGSGGDSAGDRGSSNRRGGAGGGGRRNDFKLMFFTFRDDHLEGMIDFLTDYDGNREQDRQVEATAGIVLKRFSTDLEKQQKERERGFIKLEEKLSMVEENYNKVLEFMEIVKKDERDDAERENAVDVEAAGVKVEEAQEEVTEAGGEGGEAAEGEDEAGDGAEGEAETEGGGEAETQENEEKDGLEGEEQDEGKEEAEEVVEEEVKPKEEMTEGGTTGSPKKESKSAIKYSGPYLEGKPHGKGKQFFSDGLSYVGQFLDGRRHGNGYFIDSNKSMCYVEMVDGEIAGI